MTSIATIDRKLERIDTYEAYRWARDLFEQRDYYTAARVFQRLVDDHGRDADADGGDGLGEVRELLARSYYHSAQVGRAAEVARDLLDRDPGHAYAALLLTRSLERSSRPDEAASARRIAGALGAEL